MAHPTASFIKSTLGGPAKVAEKTGRKPSAVRMWSFRRQIPRSAWPEILEAYPKVKLADLRAVETAEGAA